MLDIDGVLADFTLAFTRLMAAQHNYKEKPTYGTLEETDWHSFQGYTAEDINQAWEHVKKSDRFWEDVPPIEPDLDEAAHLSWRRDLDLYFVTSRPVGIRAKHQTETWLELNEVACPTVIVTGSKGHIAQAIGATHMIDDKPSNLMAVWEHSPSTETFLVKRGYNTELHGYPKARLVSGMGEFVEVMDGV